MKNRKPYIVKRAEPKKWHARSLKAWQDFHNRPAPKATNGRKSAKR